MRDRVNFSQIYTTRLVFRERLGKASDFGTAPVLIYDRAIEESIPNFASFRSTFAYSHAVTGGESLKDAKSLFEVLPELAEKLRPYPTRDLVLVSAGGGSVGDFVGFLASILRRGVPLVHLPSTWLAATDSAHGGKTALNLNGAKNQLGTFYFPFQVHVVRELLRGLPQSNSDESVSELAKIGLIDGGKWFARLSRGEKKLTPDEFWKALPAAIDAKYQIVRRDPFERTGVRAVLNLGHSLGHIIESATGASHGDAVGQGLLFALSWSCEKRCLPRKKFSEISDLLARRFGLVFRPPKKPLSLNEFNRLARADKKGEAAGLRFIFLRDVGKPAVKKVTFEEFAQAARRYGWLR